MANSAARAVFIVDYVGLNGAFAVNSSPTLREKALVREYGPTLLYVTAGS